MKQFSVNIRGRVKNFHLPKNQPLVPLYEAVVNSIQAIDERRQSDKAFDGKIVVKIIRDEQLTLDGSGEFPPIQSFEIIDNGIGFNDSNLDSFVVSDSSYKETFGGKGVGRFSWLIAFQKVEIESVYWGKDKYLKRVFDFSLDKSEINDLPEICKEQNENQTVVRLLNCKSPYSDNLPKRAMTIAMRMIQHCLIYFISEDCPEIILEDSSQNDVFNLNLIFKDKIQAKENRAIIEIGDEKFELLHVKAEERTVNGNKLYLCAHNRSVESKDLDKYIADLDRSIFDQSGFWYIGVLSGKYLDDSVDTNRLSFNIPAESTLESSMSTSMNQIMESVITEVEKFLFDYLTPISRNKLRRIKNYVTGIAPQFRHLMKYMADDIAKIKPNLSDDKLDDELYKIKREFDQVTTKENKELMHLLDKGIISSEEYIKRFELQIEKINSANGSALAEYVAHRKVVLDLMDFALHRQDDGKFQTESFLHNIVYPMKSTSEDLPYSNHNLWLIDEKLAYCNYISSDIPFDNKPDQERLDIFVLDHPVAVSDEENTGQEYDTIVIFELKRPMRNDYNAGSNPISQLYNYVRILKSGKAADKNGRPIRVGTNTKFYLYAVCDITNTLINVLNDHDFTCTPDKLGFYKYNDNMNAYVEILS